MANANRSACGSIAATKPKPPSMSGKACRSWVTPATPSTSRIWAATSGENAWPTTLDTMNCEVSVSPIASSVLAEADEPKIDIIAISARPIIRALAVAAVRRGLRRAFWAAIAPTVPNSRR